MNQTAKPTQTTQPTKSPNSTQPTQLVQSTHPTNPAQTPSSTPSPQKPPSLFTDKELYELCNECGKNTKLWMRKFAVLLPEVYKRNLYRKKGFYTIHEFAAKLAGMNYSTTEQILTLDRCLEGKPALRGLIETYGWSKIRVVASVATSETDKFWAEKVRELTKGALEVYVRELKAQEEREIIRNSNTEIIKTLTTDLLTGEIIQIDSQAGNRTDYKTNVGGQTGIRQIFPWEKLEPEKGSGENTFKNDLSSLTLKIDQDTEFRLRLLRQKLEKQKREPVTFSQVIKFLLDEVEKPKEIRELKESKKPIFKLKSENLEQKNLKPKEQKKSTEENKSEQKERLAKSLESQKSEIQNLKTQKLETQKSESPKKVSRYIPAQVKREIHQQYQGRCAYPNCNKPAKVLHHIKRFALIKNQDSKDIKPLCEYHHAIAHATLIKNEQEASKIGKSSTDKWELEKDITANPAFYSKTRIIDEMTQNFRSG